MREFKCVVCGTVGIDRSSTQKKMFCSKRCQWRWYEGLKQKHLDSPCIHNDGVLCANTKCEKCGWNPEVEKRRKEKLYG